MSNIPDPIDFFEQHDAEQQKWLNTLPVCDQCGEPIQDEHLFDIDGTLYHIECAEDEFKRLACNYCG